MTQNETNQSPCGALSGRQRDICRGRDDAGRPVRLRPPHTREAYLKLWLEQGLISRMPDESETSPDRPADDFRTTACRHLGDQLRVEVCKACGRNGAPAPVFACGLHGECTLRAYKTGVRRCCLTCPDFAGSARDRLTWAVGITTAPRQEPTLARTLESVAAAGWHPMVYAEPGSPVEAGVPTIGRPEKLGAWKNWLKAANQLLGADTTHVLLLQDDVELATDARLVVEDMDWPADVGAVTLYTSAKYDRNVDGRHDIPTDDFRGACALAFTAPTLRRLLAARTVREWAEDRHIDRAIGLACAELGLRIVGWSPSLGQHIGRVGTLDDKEHRGFHKALRLRQPDKLPSAAVVVLCSNYGRFLPESVGSVLSQTERPAEIVVVDDSSADDTPAVAAGFADRGVKYVRVDVGNTHQGRRAGFLATTADVLCFLDADDILPPDYLAAGLRKLLDPTVGIVYSDMEQFGAQTGRTNFPRPDDHIDRENYMHAGSLVRRNALTISRAFDSPIPGDSSNDWCLWRRVLDFGWKTAKSPAVYRYRRHPESQSYRRRGITYFELGLLDREPVTLFLPLSGRWRWLPQLRQWVETQTWPHDLVRLVAADTSGNPVFHTDLRAWISGLDYGDTRLYRQNVGLPGLADENRRDPDFNRLVREAMPRIYARMIRDATTEYIMVVEDDVLPPPDAIDRLLRSFDKDTAAVSGAYRSRFADGFVAWDRDIRATPPQDDRKVAVVHGTGFGCILLRKSVFAEHAFHHGGRGAYDYNAADWVAARGLRWRLDWSVLCRHGDIEP